MFTIGTFFIQKRNSTGQYEELYQIPIIVVVDDYCATETTVFQYFTYCRFPDVIVFLFARQLVRCTTVGTYQLMVD